MCATANTSKSAPMSLIRGSWAVCALLMPSTAYVDQSQLIQKLSLWKALEMQRVAPTRVASFRISLIRPQWILVLLI